jgi:hypothetical protein
MYIHLPLFFSEHACNVRLKSKNVPMCQLCSGLRVMKRQTCKAQSQNRSENTEWRAAHVRYLPVLNIASTVKRYSDIKTCPIFQAGAQASFVAESAFPPRSSFGTASLALPAACGECTHQVVIAVHCIHHTYLPLSCTPPHPTIIGLLLWWVC